MKFGEKIKKLRREKHITQAQLAEAVGLSSRAVQDYEIKGSYPKKRETYEALAGVLGCEVNYLLTEDEEFIAEAGEKYGYRGRRQADALIAQINGLFAGGEMPDEDKEYLAQAVQEAFWRAKLENKKYSKKG